MHEYNRNGVFCGIQTILTCEDSERPLPSVFKRDSKSSLKRCAEFKALGKFCDLFRKWPNLRLAEQIPNIVRILVGFDLDT